MKKLAFTGLAIITSMTQAQEIHKCNVHGAISYQAAPCAQGKDLTQKKASPTAEQQKHIVRYDPKVGMTAAQVENSNWGSPRHVQRIVTEKGAVEQWAYKMGYLYFKNGVLVLIHDYD